MESSEPLDGNAAALPEYRQRVRDEWIDYNGHLSEAYYVLVFGFATDEFMAHVGLGEDYRSTSGCSLYTVEAHVRYLREVPAGSELAVTSRVIDSSSKKIRLCHEMSVNGQLRATEEILAIHVDQEQGRATPLPEDVLRHLGRLGESVPEYAGRAIG